MDSFDSHLGDLEDNHTPSSLLLVPANVASEHIATYSRPNIRATASENVLMIQARLFSPRFPAEHHLNPFFAGTYVLGDELGAGGYGFVMTARHRLEGYEVAVKFIIKAKVPEHAWWDDELLGRVPTEVMIMSLINHDNIVKCLDLFEDDLYFYLVQELHGTPWMSRRKTKEKQITAPGKLLAPSPSLSTPSLTPSATTDLAGSLPGTPPQVEICVEHMDANRPWDVSAEGAPHDYKPFSIAKQDTSGAGDSNLCMTSLGSTATSVQKPVQTLEPQTFLEPPSVNPSARPNFSRRPSYDLFECIEQSKHKRLSENNARYVFAQVVEAVYYLESQGITHCDIKDENLVIDADFKVTSIPASPRAHGHLITPHMIGEQVKLIDFGSAIVADPNSTRPYYTLFFGTTAYASSEVLRKQPYQAPPAEIWTLGVLLSYLLTGHSPFPTEQDAIDGRLVIREMRGGASKLSRAALSLLARCLDRDPERRADISEVRGHRWLHGALARNDEHGLEERE
ncbi:kinase-like domain-containing protein [Cytidiella melzeri]|nr:kinase-like domain-containing protein [Cytidiella melzeri]